MVRRVRAPRHDHLAVPRDAPPAGQAPRALRSSDPRGTAIDLDRLSTPALAEALAVGAAGAALGAATGSLVGLPWLGATIGAANGLVSGARRIYDWTTPAGVGGFVLDSTWALLTTAGSIVSHGVAALQADAGYSNELSERQNRHVYERGFRVRPRFAVTVGNVISGAGDLASARRRKLVTDHEDVHVWQTRWLGPLFPIVYGGWMVGGAVAGSMVWLVGKREVEFTRFVETFAYYANPLEWWAYSRDGNWPPSGKLDGLGWQRPVVRPLRRPA